MKIRKEFKVGLLAIVAIAILYQGVSYLKGNDFFASDNTYYAVFENVEGLSISTPVTISGYPVGRVDDIKLLQDQENKIKVVFKIDDNIRLNENSRLILADKDILGEKVMQLDVGAGQRVLEENEKVTSYNAPGITDEVMKQIKPVRKEVSTLVTNVNSFVDTLKESKNDIRKSFENLRNITDDFKNISEKNRPVIRNTLANLSKVSARLEKEMVKVDTIASNLTAFSGNLKQVDIKQTVDKVDQAANNLNGVVEDINQGKGSMGKLMKDDSLYFNANKAVESLESLLSDIEAHPKRYVHFSLIGRKDKSKKE